MYVVNYRPHLSVCWPYVCNMVHTTIGRCLLTIFNCLINFPAIEHPNKLLSWCLANRYTYVYKYIPSVVCQSARYLNHSLGISVSNRSRSPVLTHMSNLSGRNGQQHTNSNTNSNTNSKTQYMKINEHYVRNQIQVSLVRRIFLIFFYFLNYIVLFCGLSGK